MPENFGIYSFIEHDPFDLFTYEGQIRAVMYIPCVKCSCYELKLAKHAYFLRFDIKLMKFRSHLRDFVVVPLMPTRAYLPLYFILW